MANAALNQAELLEDKYKACATENADLKSQLSEARAELDRAQSVRCVLMRCVLVDEHGHDAIRRRVSMQDLSTVSQQLKDATAAGVDMRGECVLHPQPLAE